jgi:succinoglycan biosynthesis protein ExoA
MSDSTPFVTLIIPFKPGPGEIQSAKAALRLDYPADKIEIIVARGRQPAVQRNHALRAAKGELVYFLDDDSVPDPGNLRRAAAHFQDPRAQLVGGPNLCPPEASALEHCFALTMASWLAFGPSRARYAKIGAQRISGEKELILCNLIARRTALLELGGFDESLYPNEENALMDELHKRGGVMIYDPECLVYRRPRKTFRAFVKMLLNYGRGRAEQFRLHPTMGSALNLAPPMFCLYLPLALAMRGLFLWPLAAYTLAVVIQTLLLKGPSGYPKLRVAPLIVLTHLLYGAGFWRGLFTRLAAPSPARAPQVELEYIPFA